tara:strand:+ start:424 stop:1113 length:690 start_codon:yes stop_codon:yes gene_type:complete
MSNKKNITAIILCGGKGQRLRPITNDIPKPLIEIKNKPILYYIIEHLKKYGIENYIIATGYKSNKIEEYMKDAFHSLNYRIVDSGDADILSRVKDCMQYVSSDVILSYGDTISDINIDKLIEFHNSSDTHITISSYPIRIPFGVMTIDSNNFVKKFIEKPILNELMNIGYYYLPFKYKNYMDNKKDLLSYIDFLIINNQLKCYQHKGIHITINTIAELNDAEDNIEKIL